MKTKRGYFMIQYLKRVLPAAIRMFLLLGLGSSAIAQEVHFKPMFEPGVKYVFKQVLESETKRKIKAFGETVSTKDDVDTELTFALKVQEFVGGTQKAELVFERVRGTMPIMGDNISYDTDSEVKSSEDVPDGYFDLDSMAQNSYKDLIGKPRELSFDAEGRLIGDAEDDTNAMGPLILSQNWGAHFVKFMTEGLPENPILPGFRWKHNHLIPVGSFGNVPIMVDYTFVGLKNVPHGAKGQAMISYVAVLDKETDSRENSSALGMMLGGVKTKITKMRMTGSLYFDPSRNIFIKHVRVIEFESESADDDDLSVVEKAKEEYSTDLISANLIAERVWTNATGQKMTAALFKVEAGIGKFRRADGREFDYEISKFSDPDQKLISDVL
jgi:hypothetical protein